MVEKIINEPRIVLGVTNEDLRSVFIPAVSKNPFDLSVPNFPITDFEYDGAGRVKGVRYEPRLANQSNSSAEEVQAAFIDKHQKLAEKIGRVSRDRLIALEPITATSLM